MKKSRWLDMGEPGVVADARGGVPSVSGCCMRHPALHRRGRPRAGYSSCGLGDSVRPSPRCARQGGGAGRTAGRSRRDGCRPGGICTPVRSNGTAGAAWARLGVPATHRRHLCGLSHRAPGRPLRSGNGTLAPGLGCIPPPRLFLPTGPWTPHGASSAAAVVLQVPVQPMEKMTDAPDLLPKVQKLALRDRDVYEKGRLAFVSFVRLVLASGEPQGRCGRKQHGRAGSRWQCEARGHVADWKNGERKIAHGLGWANGKRVSLAVWCPQVL